MTPAVATETLSNRLEQHLAKLWNADVRVHDLARIPGGASRETYRFDAEIDGKNRGLILRRDPVGSLIDTDRHIEFLAYKSFHGIVPAPEPLVIATNGGALDRPFFIMSRIDGGLVPSVMNLDPYGMHARAIGEQLFAILGRIARQDPADLPLADRLKTPAAERLLARGARSMAGRDRARRAPPAADRARGDPKAAPQSATAAARRSRSCMATTAPAISCMTGTAKSSPCWTGRWCIWAMPWKTSPGALIRCGIILTMPASHRRFPRPRPLRSGSARAGLPSIARR